MKDPDYVMKIVENYMTLDDLEDAEKRRDLIDSSGTKYANPITYQQLYGLHLNDRHQLYNHYYQIHAQILRKSMVILGILGHIFPVLSQN